MSPSPYVINNTFGTVPDNSEISIINQKIKIKENMNSRNEASALRANDTIQSNNHQLNGGTDYGLNDPQKPMME
jgi:hypothetical protein